MHLKKKTWDVEDIIRQIRALGRECCNGHNDGFTAFGLKKDLYQIQLILENELKNSPTFVGEEEWLTQQQKKRIIDILKK